MLHQDVDKAHMHTFTPIHGKIVDRDLRYTHTEPHTSFHSCCIPCFICSLLFITLHFTPQSLEQIKGCLLLYACAYSTPKSLNGIWLFSKGNMNLNIWQRWSVQTLVKASPEARHLLLLSHNFSPLSLALSLTFYSLSCIFLLNFAQK